MIKKSFGIVCASVLLVNSLALQPLHVHAEEASEIQAPASLFMQQATLVTPDSFRLGIDDYVTGFLDSSVKKVVLHVNGQTIRNGYVYSDGTFEVEAGDVINSIDDKVEIVGLDRRNNELARQAVSIEQNDVVLTADDYTLFDEEIRGIAGNQMSVVSLMVNDELIRSVNVNKDDTFVLPVESGDIIETEDFVEIVGSTSGKELARITVPVNTLDLQVDFDPFHFEEDNLISGTLSGKAHKKAKTVQLYVNRKRYGKGTVNADGTFSLNPERSITSVKDTVVVAVLNESNEELSRFQMNLHGGQYGTVDWTWDEVTQTITFGGGEFPNEGGEAGLYHLEYDSRVNNDIKKIIFTQSVVAPDDSSYLFAGLFSLEAIEGLEQLDTSDVQNMAGMFSSLESLRELNLDSFDTSSVTDMNSMFYGSRKLKSLDLRSFDTRNVIDMNSMFATVHTSGGDTQLESLDISSFDMSNVTEKHDMLFAEGLKSITLGEKSLLGVDTRIMPLVGYPEAFTGRWIGPNGKENPSIIFESGERFMADYDGSQPGTYVREVANN